MLDLADLQTRSASLHMCLRLIPASDHHASTGTIIEKDLQTYCIMNDMLWSAGIMSILFFFASIQEVVQS